MRRWWHTPSIREFLGAVSLMPMFFVTFVTIESARWVHELPSLIIVCLLCMAVTLFLIKDSVSWKIALLFPLCLGIFVSLGAGFLFLRASPVMAMGIVLLAVTWVSVHGTMWIAYRSRSAGLLVLPTLLVVIVSLAFLPPDFYIRLLYYLLATAPSMAYFHYWQRGQDYRWGFAVARLSAGMALMSLVAIPMWLLPEPDVAFRPSVLKRFEEPLYNMQAGLYKLFEHVPNRRDLPHFYLESELPFTGPIYSENDIVMVVKSDNPHKWRLRVYETYTATGWTNAVDLPIVEVEANGPISSSIGSHGDKRDEVEILVRPAARMEYMVSAGDPVIVGRMGLAEHSPIPSFKMEFISGQVDYLPLDVSTLRDELDVNRAWLQTDNTELMSRIDALGLKIVDLDMEKTGILELERRDSSPVVILGVVFKDILAPAPRHSTVGSVSMATPDMLRAASQIYPDWLADRYLQLPDDFPHRVKLLAEDLAKHMDNSYDIAQNIQSYLKSLPFDLNIVPPPPGADAVEYFLFVQRVGYCQYYASSMITMLRHLGIPARLIVGFSPGKWDNYRGAWVVEGRHFHAWPEVYFAEYGWIEFEPTPADVQPALEYLGFRPNRFPSEIQTNPEEDRCLLLMGAPCQDSSEMPETDTGFLMEEGVDGTDGRPGGLDAMFKLQVGLLLILCLTLIVIILSMFYFRRVSYRSGYPSLIYNIMGLLGALGGRRRRVEDTPLEYANRLSSSLVNEAEIVNNIAWAYVRSRYGKNKDISDEQRKQLQHSWRALRGPLLRLVFGRFRHIKLRRGHPSGFPSH